MAEDHADSRDAICALLEAAGFDVFCARDGREAVEVARTEAPDLVLMDIMMPDVDGLQAIRLLRRSAATRGTPIIAMTAMEGAERRAHRAGADELVRKPLDIGALERRMNEMLARSAQHEEARRPRAHAASG